MKNKKTQNNKNANLNEKNINTIFITTIMLVFSIGFIAGWVFSDKTLNDAELEFNTAQLELRSIYERIKFAETFNESICESGLLESMSENIFMTGKELEKLDEKNNIDTKYYDYLKQKHNLNQVLLYSEYKKYYNNCNSSENMILFFFDDNQESENQGNYLNQLVEENNGQVKVIAMHYNYTPSLDYFYKYYNIETLPTLIVNYEKKLEGLQTKEDMKTHLNITNE